MTEKAKKLAEQQVFPIVMRPEGGHYSIGLSKRELFAAMALQGMLSIPQGRPHNDAHILANHASIYADALLEQLTKDND